MIVGEYVLHLYCDDENHTYDGVVMSAPPEQRDARVRFFDRCHPAHFGGRNETDALRNAMDAGWRISRRTKTKPEGRAICPLHVKK